MCMPGEGIRVTLVNLGNFKREGLKTAPVLSRTKPCSGGVLTTSDHFRFGKSLVTILPIPSVFFSPRALSCVGFVGWKVVDTAFQMAERYGPG